MRCKDCIHDHVCAAKDQLEARISLGKECVWWERYADCENIENVCTQFKSRDAFVEVVRCKDCIHQKKTWHEDKRMKAGGYYTYWCDENDDPFVSHVVGGVDNQFCSYGERREE